MAALAPALLISLLQLGPLPAELGGPPFWTGGSRSEALRDPLPGPPVASSGPAAILRRHDREDARYRELHTRGDRFVAVGTVAGRGMGTLIDPYWVVTAAHVVTEIPPLDAHVVIQDKRRGIERVVLHPAWRRVEEIGDRGAVVDLALIRLREPVVGVEPVLLYKDADEVGREILFVGNGMTGTGLTGPVSHDRRWRAATNTVEQARGNWLLFEFSAPPRATDLEGISGPGDSGGPALIERDGRLFILGVSSDNDGAGDGFCRYGSTEHYARISSTREWIEEVMASYEQASEVESRTAPRARIDGASWPLVPPGAAAVALAAITTASAVMVAKRQHPEQSMLAVRIKEFGPPKVLRVERVARPTPGRGELLVRVHAAAVNPIDTIIRADGARGLADAQLPYTPGFDLSGVVVELGDEVKGFEVGDEVLAMLHLRRGGAYAEYAIVKVGEAARKPANVTHEEAASLPLVALTAWQALFETAGLEAGQTVLIHAGAGGVGSIAIQLARWKGATVIATASEGNHEYLRGLGAQVVIDYRTQRFEEIAKDVDVVLDPIGGDTQTRSLALLSEGGILVSLVGLGPAAREPAPGVRAAAMLVEPKAEQLEQIAKLVKEGKLKPTVSQRFPLSAAALAHEQSETRRTRGKIVLRVIE